MTGKAEAMTSEFTEFEDPRRDQPERSQQQDPLAYAVSKSSAIFYIAGLDENLPIRFISANVEALTGHEVSAFLHQPGYAIERLHPDDAYSHAETIRTLKADGTLTQEYRFATASGEYRWFRDEMKLVENDGQPAEFVGCMVDITTEKESQVRSREEDSPPAWQGDFVEERMAEELRESEELVRLVLESSQVPVRMWSPVTGRTIYESPACCELLGRNDSPSTGRKRHSIYVDPQDRVRLLLELREAGAVDNFEMQLCSKKDVPFWASVSARLIEYKGEEVVVSTLIDLSERRATEQALRGSEELVRRVLEACPVVITMNRADDGTIIYESPAAQVLLNLDEPQEGQSVVSRWADPADRLRYLDLLRRTGAVDGLEVRYMKANGEVFPCALSSRLIEYRGEEVIVSNLIDLTDRHREQAELTRQRELLHQSEKLSALGELLAGVSHELNNPLSVLVGQTLMMQETARDEETARRAERLGKAANRCARIVKTFLAMARQEPSETVPVRIGEVVDFALEVTAYSLRTSNVEVSLRMARDLPSVMGDPDQLRHVLTNLIVNAQHALQAVEGPRKLRITTSYSKKNDSVAIKVKDNGPGIPEDIRLRIFEPLYTTKDVGKGTGIGLALCHRIIEAHGGTIEVESPQGDGAAFAIRLPCTAARTDAQNAKRTGRRVSNATRVLVIDDEEEVGETVMDILQNEGHEVDVVTTGGLALEKIKQGRYDIILSDIRMPEMDGPHFFRELAKVDPRQIEALAFITGDTLSPDVRDFLDSCERPYLEKPFAPADLRELVGLLIRRRAC